MASERIAVVGDGQMGLVCAALLAQAPGVDEVRLWGHEPRAMEALAQTRVSERLPGVRLSERVRVTGEGAPALEGATMAISAVPTQFLRGVWGALARHAPESGRCPVVSVTKGIENGTLLRPTQVIADVLRDHPDRAPRGLAVLSGPTIAAEMGRFLPATMVAASSDEALARRVQALFSTSWLRIYTGDDPLGVEIAGATKNVIALAAGILDGLHAGYNAKSALLARGLAEIARLGVAMGASRETFFGLAGIGDLATTCFSPEGRNRSCGEALGKGEGLAEYLGRAPGVVEGVATTRSVVALAERFRVEMPITQAVHAVLFEGTDPIDAIARLMSRGPKAERVG
ncbi:MAG TPA: glycerol-3-phosphate dehydrogenase [Phycisphaerales bacterium]|nr:glycerol-3-phosphate dehydrogenase [Phycisphaerales bacterium]